MVMANHYEMLEEALASYEKATRELEEFRARVSRAEVDEEATLNDHSLPEDQATKELTNAQKLKAVYTARAAHKEKGLAGLGPKLEEAFWQTERELWEGIAQESQRRSAFVQERVLEVLAIGGDLSVISSELAVIVRHASLVRRIEDLQPSGSFEQGRIEHTLSRAKQVLENSRRLAEERASQGKK